MRVPRPLAAGTQTLDAHPKNLRLRMKIRPLADRIVIKRLESEERTKGGIIIPDTAKEKPVEGKVVAVGSGKLQKNGKLRTPAVKEGDRVLLGKYSGTEVKLDGIEHVIVSEDEILAVLS
jgi:chaperonin GroES